jgi:hypothetical protein
MSENQYFVVSGVLFSLVAIAHLLRIVFGIPVYVDEYTVPMLFSWIGFIVPGALAVWAFRLSGAARAG